MDQKPWVSLILVCHNDGKWLPRCVESIRAQSIFDRLELILVDDVSDNGSDKVGRDLIAGLPNSKFMATKTDSGYGASCNFGAEAARGKYLYFLNPDTWLEADCVERLYETAERSRAGVVSGSVLQYDNDALESVPAVGFDFCGNGIMAKGPLPEVLLLNAAFFFIRHDLFLKVGKMDGTYYLTSEETDLSWRVWIAGEKIVPATASKIHHRGAVGVNPTGGATVAEHRTSTRKRYYANRNRLVSIAKDCQHVLLLLLIPSMMTVLAEGLVTLAATRDWSVARGTSFDAIAGFFRMRRHIFEERRRIASFRCRSDWWMLRFFRLGFGRWHEVAKALKGGYPRFK